MSKPQINIMVDTETLGLGPTSVVLSIGALVFDPYEQILGQSFYTEIDITDSQRKIDIATLKFWFDQAAEGCYPELNGRTLPAVACRDFYDYLVHHSDQGNKDLIIWCNGTDFDIPLLQNFMRQNRVTPPWKYSSVRDCRTIYKLFEGAVPKPEAIHKHHALEDCYWQATYLTSILSNLKAKLNVN